MILNIKKIVVFMATSFLRMNIFVNATMVSQHIADSPLLSDIYKVEVNGESHDVFKNCCNKFVPNAPGHKTHDDKPLTKFAGRTIHWTHFSIDKPVQVIIHTEFNIDNNEIIVLPLRHKIKAKKIGNNKISLTIPYPGQYSVEVGKEGYKKAILLFADPIEKNKVKINGSWIVLENATASSLNDIASSKNAIYFKSGVHNIGIFNLPKNIKEIYIEKDAWVYGSFIMNGKEDSNVFIHGRGTLSGAKFHLRESHLIEAKNGASGIKVEGIVLSDYVYYAIRLLGGDNLVDWTKIVGGWIYNCDGIAAYENSTIKNCFVWANDDNIKIYRDNIVVENIVCWQLDNGGVIQLNWSNSKAKDCVIRNIDIIHAEWDSDRYNNGIISCRSAGGSDKNFLFENINIDTPVSHIFRLSPQGEKQIIENFVFRNWNIKMRKPMNFHNYIEGVSENCPIRGLTFDNFVLNNVKLSNDNYKDIANFNIKNVEGIVFK